MRILLTLIVIYLVIRLVARIVFPILLKMFVNKPAPKRAKHAYNKPVPLTQNQT
jgi:hypothetical protein